MIERLKQYVKVRYGSLVGLKNALKYKLLFKLGRYQKYQRIPFPNIKRLVFICSGNICRSPLAEYVARQKWEHVESYGLHCRGGDPADPRAIAFAQKHGIDMSKHRTRNIKDYVPREGDLLVGMEPKHAEELEALLGRDKLVTLAGLWLYEVTAYLHDPFSANELFFDWCEMAVCSASTNLVTQILLELT